MPTLTYTLTNTGTGMQLMFEEVSKTYTLADTFETRYEGTIPVEYSVISVLDGTNPMYELKVKGEVSKLQFLQTCFEDVAQYI
jgi:hypothetical protein